MYVTDPKSTNYYYTVGHKKWCHFYFYFYDNFGTFGPISIILASACMWSPDGTYAAHTFFLEHRPGTLHYIFAKSCFGYSRVFHPCHLVPPFPLPRFQSPHLRSKQRLISNNSLSMLSMSRPSVNVHQGRVTVIRQCNTNQPTFCILLLADPQLLTVDRNMTLRPS